MKNITRYLLVYSLLIFFAGSVAAAGESEYDAGIHAFKDGDYTRALQHFESARAQGRKSPRLTYNLAVTHYKLGHLDRAERLFSELEGNAEYSDLARYNLGLIAMKQSNDDEAARRFRQVRRSSDNDRLVYLAGQGLRQLQRPVRVKSSARPGKDWLSLLSLGGGYNDNPLAFPELQQARLAGGDDYFMELMGYGQIYLSGHSGNGLRLHGFGFTKQYLDLNTVDVSVVTAGLSRENSLDGWQYAYGGSIGHSQVDGNTLTNRIQGDFEIERSLGGSTYSLTYRPVYHDAGNRYSYLDGWQHKVDLRWRKNYRSWRWTARYRFVYNDRDNLRTAANFLSFSPRRHRFLLEADWEAVPSLTLTLGGEYTHSRYQGENRFTDADGVFKVAKRKADKIEAWLKAEYELTSHWRVRGEYEFTNNDENFELYKYNSNELKAVVEFLY